MYISGYVANTERDKLFSHTSGVPFITYEITPQGH